MKYKKLINMIIVLHVFSSRHIPKKLELAVSQGATNLQVHSSFHVKNSVQELRAGPELQLQQMHLDYERHCIGFNFVVAFVGLPFFGVFVVFLR